MAKWTDYTTDTEPTDNDEVMTLDADKSPKANKRVTLSTLADYFLDKLASKVFAKLETQNKTVIDALNELNSKTPSKDVYSLKNYMKNAPMGVSFCDCQGANDNPGKGSMSICMTYVNDDHTWGLQYLFVYGRIRYRTMSNGAVEEWKQII